MLTHLLLASSSSILTVSGSLASSVSTEEGEDGDEGRRGTVGGSAVFLGTRLKTEGPCFVAGAH